MISVAILMGVLAVHYAQGAPMTDGQGANFSKAVNYLTRYGYLKELDGQALLSMGEGEGSSSLALKTAMVKFQTFFHIPATGVIDEVTLELIGRPRCGHKDLQDGEPFGSTVRAAWTHSPVTWRLMNHSPDLPSTTIDSVIRRAFGDWDRSCGISFSGVSSGADIEVSFKKGDHGDGYPFDGPHKVLAHAFYPSVGDTHFDEDEDWTDGVSSGINLFQVALHEFGHALGLEHSDNSEAVMYPSYIGYQPDYALAEEDISRCQALYG